MVEEQHITLEHSSDDEEFTVDRTNKSNCFVGYIAAILFGLYFYVSMYFIFT